MVPLNLLLLPLLGGFIFVSQWYPTRYYTLRTDGYRLIFTTAVAGVLLLFVASVLKTYLAPQFPFWARAYFWWHRVAPPEHSGTAALAMLLGICLWYPLNLLGRRIRFLSDGQAVNQAITRKHDALELFLKMALRTERLISASVENGKVYVGYLTSNYNPAFPMESISLIPILSGHRHESTKEIVLDLNYVAIYEAMQQDLMGKLLDAFLEDRNKNRKASEDQIFHRVLLRLAYDAGEDFEIIIPIGEVQSVNIFHIDSYVKHASGSYRILSPLEAPGGKGSQRDSR